VRRALVDGAAFWGRLLSILRPHQKRTFFRSTSATWRQTNEPVELQHGQAWRNDLHSLSHNCPIEQSVPLAPLNCSIGLAPKVFVHLLVCLVLVGVNESPGRGDKGAYLCKINPFAMVSLYWQLLQNLIATNANFAPSKRPEISSNWSGINGEAGIQLVETRKRDFHREACQKCEQH